MGVGAPTSAATTTTVAAGLPPCHPRAVGRSGTRGRRPAARGGTEGRTVVTAGAGVMVPTFGLGGTRGDPRGFNDLLVFVAGLLLALCVQFATLLFGLSGGFAFEALLLAEVLLLLLATLGVLGAFLLLDLGAESLLHLFLGSAFTC